jgi:transcriptional regulator with XRE-family HTH domain
MPLNLGRLEALMKQRRVETKDIAAKIEVNGHTVYRWVTGATQPTSINLAHLAEVLQTSTDYLLGNTDDPTPPKRSQVDLTTMEYRLIDAYRRGDLREIMRLLGGGEE